jgi:hypothetical protein
MARGSDYEEAYDETDDEELGGPGEKDAVEGDDTPLDEDTFGMALCALTRDTHFLSHGFEAARCCRLTTTLLLLFVTIGIQLALLHNTKQYVSAKAVHDIRNAYDIFENAIYLCKDENGTVNTARCFETPYGKLRGKPEAKPDLATQSARLYAMSDEDQGGACRIPLSQPPFFFLILLIWSLTCLKELRSALNLTMEIFKLKTTPTMLECFEGDAKEDEEGDHISGDVVIIALTWPIKLFMILLLIVRVATTVYLLWLGCRWLLATNHFADLILNAIALEFILQLKELVHQTLVPARNAKELSMTTIYNANKKMKPGFKEFMGTVSILFIACVWVWYYMYHYQQVLPEYQWDVREVCTKYIAKRFNVSAR